MRICGFGRQPSVLSPERPRWDLPACGGTGRCPARAGRGGSPGGRRGNGHAPIKAVREEGDTWPVILSLFRLQVLAFRRAPYLGGRIALATVKGIGVAYAFVCATILGVVLPDLLGVVAPTLDAVAGVASLFR